jgi:hypothetical protein
LGNPEIFSQVDGKFGSDHRTHIPNYGYIHINGVSDPTSERIGSTMHANLLPAKHQYPFSVLRSVENRAWGAREPAPRSSKYLSILRTEIIANHYHTETQIRQQRSDHASSRVWAEVCCTSTFVCHGTKSILSLLCYVRFRIWGPRMPQVASVHIRSKDREALDASWCGLSFLPHSFLNQT